MTFTRRTKSAGRRRIIVGLLSICAIALLLRAYHVWAAVAVSPDSALLITYARELAHDPLAALRAYDQHPLFPVLILLFHGPIGSIAGDGPTGWILAGQLVAIAGSFGAILAIYWLTSRIYGRRRGLIAAAMLAVLPDACRFGADVLTDLPHMALYLTGLAALLTGMQTRLGRYLLIAAVSSALAFLTRPEGGAVLLVGLLVILMERGWPLRRRIGWAAAMVAVFFCLAGPYQLATGKLVPKKSPSELFKFGFAARTERPAGGIELLLRSDPDRSLAQTGASRAANLPVPVNVLRQWVRAGRVVYILLAIVGVIVARPRGVAARVLGSALGLHLLLLHALEYRYGYLDRRHALILVALSLPVAAEGAWWLSRRLATRLGRPDTLTRSRLVVGIVALCVLLTSPWLLRPVNAGSEHVRSTANWLAAHTAPGTPIIGDRRMWRVAMYADRPFIEWRWWGGNVRYLARCLHEHPEGYFLVDTGRITSAENNPAFFEDLDAWFGERLKLLHAEPAPPDARPTEIRIYRLRVRAESASRR
jgi:hypothetical protein